MRDCAAGTPQAFARHGGQPEQAAATTAFRIRNLRALFFARVIRGMPATQLRRGEQGETFRDVDLQISAEFFKESIRLQMRDAWKLPKVTITPA